MAFRSILLMFALATGSAPAAAGLVFSETEVIETDAAPALRQVRRVFAQDGQLKSIVEDSADALVPAGSYLLVSGGEAMFVDPARSTIAPVAASDMHPVPASPGQATASRRFSSITLRLQGEEPGPTLLGLATRHYVYLLSYQEDVPGEATGAATLSEERHEFWAAELPAEEPALAVWRELRVAEDAGAGSARQDIRAAMARMHEHGLFLRHVIERRDRSLQDPNQPEERERVLREVTAISRENIAAEAFGRPAGYAQTEFLAPGPDETTSPGQRRREMPGPAGPSPTPPSAE